MELKKLYENFCKTSGRNYFKNYPEMVDILNLNPHSSRRTNYAIVESYCKIQKDKQKIYLYDFISKKQSLKESQKLENKRYSYTSLIREYFYLLNAEKNAENKETNYFDSTFFYFTKPELRENLGFIRSALTAKNYTTPISNQINIIKNFILPGSGDCTDYFVKEYLFDIKAIANSYIKTALTKAPEILLQEIYVLYDKNRSKTYITNTNTIEKFKNKQKKIFMDIANKSKNDIRNLRDLIFFEKERKMYYAKSVMYLQKNVCKETTWFESAYKIIIDKNTPYKPLGLTLDEVKTRISKKFYQTMTTRIKNKRKTFCTMDATTEKQHIAGLEIEAEKNIMIERKRTEKLAVQRANNDNIICTAFINLLLLHESYEIKLFASELNEYIIKDDGNERIKAANKEIKKSIRKLRDRYNLQTDDLIENRKRMEKNKDIIDIKQILEDLIN